MILERGERLEQTLKVNFCLYLDPENIHNINEHNTAWSKASKQIFKGQAVELQYETRYDLGYWKYIPGFFNGKVDGVHAPTKGRDIASSDGIFRKWSVDEHKRSMDLANELSAKYFLVHLTPQDDFNNRNVQLQFGYESLRDLASYRREKGYESKIILETLEYPKWPSNVEETVEVIKNVKQFLPDVGFCLDVGHLWHNHNSLLPKHGAFSFQEILEKYTSDVANNTSIDVFHLVGAYVENIGCVERHTTHAMPGVSPGDKFSEKTKMYYSSAPPGFFGSWMDIDTSLKTILNYSKETYKHPIIAIEGHDPNIDMQLLACQRIRERINFLKK